jgi:hypothetical protein
MKRCVLVLAILATLSCARVSHGMAQEKIGPDSVRKHPTTAQPGWPMGMTNLLRHTSRVYSIWVNGNGNFYFKATPAQINELIGLFSEIRMRDHELWIKTGKGEAESLDGDRIDYNANFHVLGGIALGMSRRDESPDTYEPTLTVYVHPSSDQTLLKQITLPANVILNTEVANCPLKSKATQPERRVWHAQVQFDDSTPAADFEHGLSTKITLWEKDIKEGVNLGRVGHKGHFHAAFSDKEIADLRTGKSWLTLTAGNWLTEAKMDHPKLGVERLALDKVIVQPVMISRLRFYHGRILFENGSPPILDPGPWAGAEIEVDFSYAGSPPIDAEGYFRAYFTEEQYEKVKAKKDRKNIYIPSYEERGSSTARFIFPVSKLSQEKEDAGVVRIPRPGPKKNDSE